MIKDVLKKKLNSFVTVCVFVLAIAIFTIISLITPSRNFSPTENRYLAQKPTFTVDSFFEGEFSKDYESYLTDQFFGRDTWIEIKTRGELGLLRTDINDVYVSKDDYLIEMQNHIDETKAYSNADRMLTFVNNQAATLGKDHVSMMIVPTAVNILSDKLPAFAYTFDQDAYIDYIMNKAVCNFVDTRKILKTHSNDYIYYKTDHHWTTYGAYLAYTKWASTNNILAYSEEMFDKELAATDFLGTIYSKVNYAKSPDNLYIYRLKDKIAVYNIDYNMGASSSTSLFEESHLATKDKYSVFLNGNNSIVTINTEIDQSKLSSNNYNKEGKLLVIKDSYAHCFLPFIANHYGEVVVIDMRYLKKSVNQIVEEYGITDILVLYNAIHFAEDGNMALLEMK